MCENGNIGQQLNHMCKHDKKQYKPIKNMQICPNAMKYCMQLIESGEMDAIGCEPCTIAWLCDDPVETCMNPEDDHQWWLQCVQSIEFWMEHIEHALNNMDWLKRMGTHMYYDECIKSIVELMEKHNLKFKLVVGE